MVIPTGKKHATPKSIEAIADCEAFIQALKRLDLTPENALRIVNVLKNRNLIDFEVFNGKTKDLVLPTFSFLPGTGIHPFTSRKSLPTGIP
jgi:hypothetical protein